MELVFHPLSLSMSALLSESSGHTIKPVLRWQFGPFCFKWSQSIQDVFSLSSSFTTYTNIKITNNQKMVIFYHISPASRSNYGLSFCNKTKKALTAKEIALSTWL